MCCQYYFGDETIEYLESLVSHMEAGTDSNPNTEQRTGAAFGLIRPSDRSLLLTGRGAAVGLEVMSWGFPGIVSGQLLINARAETVNEKRAFSEAMRYRRCIVPAERFFEWDRSHQKVTFETPDHRRMYMAGIYDLFEERDRFTILTTQANESVLPVHDRMPLLLEEDCLQEWLFDDGAAQELLRIPGPELITSREYDQLSLFA